MQNEIKICRSLDEYENPIWRLPNGKKLDLYTRNSTGNFRAKAVDSKGVDRQVIVVDDVQDRHAVIYLDEQTLDQIHDITWLTLDAMSEEYLTEHSYMVGVPELFDLRTGLPLGIPAEGMDADYLALIRSDFVRRSSMSEVFTHPPVFVTGLQEAGPKVTKDDKSYLAFVKLSGVASLNVQQEPVHDQVPVKWFELRGWYSDARYELVYQGLYERTMLYINAVWPQVVLMNKAHELATSILADLTIHSEDMYSDHLQHLLNSIGMDDTPTWTMVRNMQSVMGRVLIAGPIQTPWERGEELCWNV